MSFKTSWDYFIITEAFTSKKIFFILAITIFVYFFVGAILPFIASFTEPPACSSVSPIYVYITYAGFIFISTIIELVIFFILRKALIVNGKSLITFNRYFLAKYAQG